MKLCNRVPLTSKAILLPFLREHFLAEEPVHEVLATSFEFRRDETVDVLAVNAEGRLVVALAHLDEPASLMDDLLRRLHWMIENAPLVQRMFPAVEIDPTQPPRIALALPRLSERAREVLRYFSATELDVYEYRLIELGDHLALLMELVVSYPRATEEAPAVPPQAAPAPREEAEAALDEVVAGSREEVVVASPEQAPARGLTEDENVEIHVDDINVAELGVSEEELLELLNIEVPRRGQAP